MTVHDKIFFQLLLNFPLFFLPTGYAQIQLQGDTIIAGQVFDGQFEEERSQTLSFVIRNDKPGDTVRSSRCIFKNYSLPNGALISLENAQNVVIDSCIFENIRGTRPGVDVHAIACQDSGTEVRVCRSIFRNIAADGIQLGHLRYPGDSHNIRDREITGNAFYDSGENGIDIKNVQGGILISGNFFTGSRGCPGGQEGCSGDAGIGLIIHQGGSGVTVRGNTFYQNNRGITVKKASRGGVPQQITIEDNLFYENISQIKEAGWGLKLGAVHGAVVRGNVFVDNHARRDLVINEKTTKNIRQENNHFLSPQEFNTHFRRAKVCPFPMIWLP